MNAVILRDAWSRYRTISWSNYRYGSSSVSSYSGGVWRRSWSWSIHGPLSGSCSISTTGRCVSSKSDSK